MHTEIRHRRKFGSHTAALALHFMPINYTYELGIVWVWPKQDIKALWPNIFISNHIDCKDSIESFSFTLAKRDIIKKNSTELFCHVTCVVVLLNISHGK